MISVRGLRPLKAAFYLIQLVSRLLAESCILLCGFGFVQYVDQDDDAETKYYMDRTILLSIELAVVLAKGNRKNPLDMRVSLLIVITSNIYDKPCSYD